MTLHPFLASLFFARPFLLGSFWGVSPDLRAKSRLRRLRSETRLRAQCDGRPGRRPDPEPFGHVGYAQPFEKGGPKL